MKTKIFRKNSRIARDLIEDKQNYQKIINKYSESVKAEANPRQKKFDEYRLFFANEQIGIIDNVLKDYLHCPEDEHLVSEFFADKLHDIEIDLSSIFYITDKSMVTDFMYTLPLKNADQFFKVLFPSSDFFNSHVKMLESIFDENSEFVPIGMIDKQVMQNASDYDARDKYYELYRAQDLVWSLYWVLDDQNGELEDLIEHMNANIDDVKNDDDTIRCEKKKDIESAITAQNMTDDIMEEIDNIISDFREYPDASVSMKEFTYITKQSINLIEENNLTIKKLKLLYGSHDHDDEQSLGYDGQDLDYDDEQDLICSDECDKINSMINGDK